MRVLTDVQLPSRDRLGCGHAGDKSPSAVGGLELVLVRGVVVHEAVAVAEDARGEGRRRKVYGTLRVIRGQSKGKKVRGFALGQVMPPTCVLYCFAQTLLSRHMSGHMSHTNVACLETFHVDGDELRETSDGEPGDGDERRAGLN